MRQLLPVLFVVIAIHYTNGQAVFTLKGVAIRGYDPVAYFTDSKAVKGSKKFSYTWLGTEWRFRDKGNLEQFKSDPEKYAPQFGGYCAYGVSENHKSPTDPDAFTVVNEKLYLNYSIMVKELWTGDREKHIVNAEKNWVELKNKE